MYVLMLLRAVGKCHVQNICSYAMSWPFYCSEYFLSFLLVMMICFFSVRFLKAEKFQMTLVKYHSLDSSRSGLSTVYDC